ncbi:MAG TPA: histidine phosphatase family protein, partial [Casimicrobiaceae bacterium]|nr:histidine phosphatase family protein [Casimicrobiaceae bacterium]
TRALAQDWVDGITAVYSSTERKALDGAGLLAAHRGLGVVALAALGENDRTSTGYLPPDEFERTADAFFAHPGRSVRGWERAVDAQARIVAAVDHVLAHDASAGDIAIVAHGAVGTLLYCHLASVPIDRRWDQPRNGGGNRIVFGVDPRVVHGWWQPIDAASAPAAPPPAP